MHPIFFYFNTRKCPGNSIRPGLTGPAAKPSGRTFSIPHSRKKVKQNCLGIFTKIFIPKLCILPPARLVIVFLLFCNFLAFFDTFLSFLIVFCHFSVIFDKKLLFFCNFLSLFCNFLAFFVIKL